MRTRFRQGGKVPENVYDMKAQPHKPIMIAPTPELAEEYVSLMNKSMDEKYFDPYIVPEAFVKHGENVMRREWAKTEIVSEPKFLVVRRDGTVPAWPHFVMGARDPWVPPALLAYADAAEASGAHADFVSDIRTLAQKFIEYRDAHGAGDPDAPRHRVDDPSILQIMRDCQGGKVFIAAAWDADQLKREVEKEKQA